MQEKTNKIFQYVVNSNAAPFFSDTDSGFIEAKDPMEALEKIVKDYKHPAGLFSAVVKEPSPENPVLARYLSARAATQEAGGTGWHERKKDGLYVNDKKIPEQNEMYELVKDD